MNILSMKPTDIVVRIFAVFVCLTFHEFAHGCTAYFLGDTTAQRQGRLTLSPMAHIDPIGLICLFLAGIGWAKPVPVNPGLFRMKNRRLGLAITAAAGPLSNFLMSFICVFIYYLLLIFINNPLTVAISRFLSEIAILGIGLGVFNLIPIPPLDGSKILMMFLPYRAIEWLHRYEGYIRFVFLIAVFFGSFSSIIRQGMGYVINYMERAVFIIFHALGII